MKTLYLLRHGKSAWDDSEAADHDRELSPRGVKAASAIGKYLAGKKAAIDLALCSSARRTSDTLDLMMAELPARPMVERERGLYLCGERVLLERIKDAPDDVTELMVVAHNPDLHALGISLSVTAAAAVEDDEHCRALTMKFPTGACAVILFENATRWRDVAPGTGRLMEFILPRKLV